jgi:maltooligosyltrehalose trehalohydrolase
VCTARPLAPNQATVSHQFRVWAPDADVVEVELVDTGTTNAMEQVEHGWWACTVEGAGHGAGYLFHVDGGPGRPDPRSAWQPDGVHGPSRVVDHASYRWHDDGFRAQPLSQALIYELHLGTFSAPGSTPAPGQAGGGWRSAIEHLDHLADLGITHVEVMPVATFAGRWGWGYDGVDLFAPFPGYGTPEDMKAFVDACHGRGLGVLLDVVYNHLGPEGNYLATFGPYFTDVFATPWGDAVNLNGPGSTEVRRFIVDNALMWLRDYHVDGLRLDAVHALLDTNAVHILEQLATAVADLSAELDRPLVLIAESDRNDPRVVEPRSAGGMGLDAHWNDDFHHAVHVALTDERDSYYADYGGLAPIAEALTHAYVYRGQYSEYRDRHHGREPQGVLGHSFVGYVQNHDQIGNRAGGERASQLLSLPRLKVAAALVLTAPFVPMIFQGEEWGASAPFPYFADHEDPGLADAVRKGRLEEFASFGWSPEDVLDPEAPGTFASAVLDWDQAKRPPHAEVLAWYRALVELRFREPALTDGRLDLVDVDVEEDHATLRYRRGDLVVAVNLGPERARLELHPAGSRARVTGVTGVAGGSGVELVLVLASDERAWLEGSTIVLPPDSVAVVRA